MVKKNIQHCRNNSKSWKFNRTKSYIHDRSLSWLETNISIKGGGVKLVLCVQLIYFYAHRRARYLYIDVIHQW